ncbi:hypothetical protein ABK040_004121 [Willaertia magna]
MMQDEEEDFMNESNEEMNNNSLIFESSMNLKSFKLPLILKYLNCLRSFNISDNNAMTTMMEEEEQDDESDNEEEKKLFTNYSPKKKKRKKENLLLPPLQLPSNLPIITIHPSSNNNTNNEQYNFLTFEKDILNFLPMSLQHTNLQPISFFSQFFEILSNSYHLFKISFHQKVLNILKKYGIITYEKLKIITNQPLSVHLEHLQSKIEVFEINVIEPLLNYLMKMILLIGNCYNNVNNNIEDIYISHLIECFDILNIILNYKSIILLDKIENIIIPEIITLINKLIILKNDYSCISEKDNSTPSLLRRTCAYLLTTISNYQTANDIVNNYININIDKYNLLLWNDIEYVILLIGLFKINLNDKLLQFLHKSLTHQHFRVRSTCCWSISRKFKNHNLNIFIKKFMELLSIEMNIVKQSIIVACTTFCEEMDFEIYSNYFLYILDHLYSSLQKDLELKDYNVIINTFDLINVIINVLSPHLYEVQSLWIKHIIDIFLLFEQSMSMQCKNNDNHYNNGSYDNVCHKFRKIHSYFFKSISSSPSFLFLLNDDELKLFKVSIISSLKRLLFRKMEDKDYIYLDYYLQFLNILLPYYRESIGSNEEWIKENCNVFLVLLRNLKLQNNYADISYYVTIINISKYLYLILNPTEIIQMVVIDNLLNRFLYLSQLEFIKLDHLLYLTLISAITELLRDNFKYLNDSLVIEKLKDILDCKVLPLLNSFQIYQNLGDDRIVEFYIKIKSSFCNLISVIYCYCFPSIIEKNFQSIRDTFINFPEQAQLQLGNTQFEYYYTLIHLLNSICNVNNENHCISFDVIEDFLCNELLVDSCLISLKRLKRAIDMFYFRSQLLLLNLHDEQLTSEWKLLFVQAKRLEYMLMAQVKDLQNA